MTYRHAIAATLTLTLAGPAAAQADRPETILALRRALVAHEFAQLDSSLTDRQRESRVAGNESRYVYAFDAFSTKDSTYRRHFDAWVAARPTSTHALAARSSFFVDMAWRARGTGWASETKDSQMRAMERSLQLAVTDLVSALRLDSTNIVAYAAGSVAARMMGDDEWGRRIVARALSVDSANFTVRVTHLEALRPRWGGSIEEIDRFAADAQRHAGANPRLTSLRGFSAYERAVDLQADDRYLEARAALDTALSYGDFWRYRVQRGEVYRMLEQPEKALVDFNRAVAQRPGAAEAIAWRAVAYVDLARLEEGPASAWLLQRARDDLRLARDLDPAESTVVWARKSYPELSAVRSAERAGAP